MNLYLAIQLFFWQRIVTYLLQLCFLFAFLTVFVYSWIYISHTRFFLCTATLFLATVILQAFFQLRLYFRQFVSISRYWDIFLFQIVTLILHISPFRVCILQMCIYILQFSFFAEICVCILQLLFLFYFWQFLFLYWRFWQFCYGFRHEIKKKILFQILVALLMVFLWTLSLHSNCIPSNCIIGFLSILNLFWRVCVCISQFRLFLLFFFFNYLIILFLHSKFWQFFSCKACLCNEIKNKIDYNLWLCRDSDCICLLLNLYVTIQIFVYALQIYF